MWVRSQDRETLAQVDFFDLSEDADGKIEIVVFSKNGLIDTMGIYKTKERALEVLDEIQVYVVGKILIPTDYSGYNFDDTSPVNGSVVMDKIEILPTVYNMPKE